MILSGSKVATRTACIAMVSALLGCAGLLPMESFSPPPVCEALVSGNLARATQLVNEGADPNAGHGCALIASASRGQLEMVKLLLDHGANPNRVVSGDLTVIMGGTTPLVAAVQSRDIRMVQLLLERGADPRNDIEAFEVVINFSDVPMAELLLRHGANANMKRLAGGPVYYSVEIRPREFQQKEVPPRDLAPDRIDETMNRLRCDVSTYSGKSLLHVAIDSWGVGGQEGKEGIAMLLIKRGADPNGRTLIGSTPLMLAARRDMRGAISMLKEAGADVKATDRCGRTAADYARSYDTKALVGGYK